MHKKLNQFYTAVNDIANTISVESLHAFIGLSLLLMAVIEYIKPIGLFAITIFHFD